ncbi:hypothetical protein L2E82_10695 [Cichorium intybus]|uniref:Uncharacterized protein n=1 Tax=Cichorium intybus TaxID=13427 RepID=A0ACB9GBE5_CICIN|nr:hypothetical protein L2E82_10695 [Cichorium intybus]
MEGRNRIKQDHATHGAGFVDRSGKFYDTSGIKKGQFTVNNANNKFVKTKSGSKVKTVEDDEENDGERREAENDNHGEKDFGKAHKTENEEDRQQKNEKHDDSEIKKWSDSVGTQEVPVFNAKNIDGGLEFVHVDENGDEVIKKGPSPVEARLEKEVGSGGSKSDSLLYRGRRSNSLGSIKSNMKRVPTDVDNINDVMAQYMEMRKMLGYDMESNKQKVEKMLGRSGDWGGVSLFPLKISLNSSKDRIQTWNTKVMADSVSKKLELEEKLKGIDEIIDAGNGSSDIAKERYQILKEVAALDSIRSLDILQKAKGLD